MSRTGAILLALCAGWCGEALADAAADERTRVERIDDAHASQADFFGVLFDRIDRLFGEQYVEDRDRKVQVRAGVQTTLNDEGRSVDTGITLALRVPLPALERRSVNLFLEVGEDVRELGPVSSPNFDESRRRLSIGAGVVARPREEVETGLKLNVFREEGSFASIYPFVRFERKRAPMRYFAEQRLVWESEDLWRARTDVDVDRTLGNGMFARLRNRADYVIGDPGVEFGHGLLLRQVVFGSTGASYELWLEYNSAGDDPATLDDDTIAYAQLRWRGRVWRRWLEYELRPAYTVVIDSDRDPFFSLLLSISVVWDSFLGGGAAGHPAAASR